MAAKTQINVQIVPKCKTHSRYKGIRPPTVDCPNCWAVYNSKLGRGKHTQKNISIPNTGAFPVGTEFLNIPAGKPFLHVKVGNDNFPVFENATIDIYNEMVKSGLLKHGIKIPVLTTNHTVDISLKVVPKKG